jgi:transaldolase
MTKLHQVAELGQAIWLDYIHRALIASGELGRLVDQGIRGVTSNPSIFQQAITGGDDYWPDLRRLTLQGLSAVAAYEHLAVADVQAAADVLLPLYQRTHALDGYVSLEVSPLLAHDRDGTIAEAQRLWSWLGRPNVLIKVPATPAGVPAIEELIALGINVNVTLIFALEQYRQIAEAYIRGLERAAAAGRDIRRIRSVASLFVSRLDAKIDPLLERQGATSLMGKIAVANAKLCYRQFGSLFGDARWQRLVARGACVQRPLWASTSTKNPAYRDTLYVDELIGPDTVNTAPPETVAAFTDHGTVARTVDRDVAQAESIIAPLTDLGIDLAAVNAQLLDEGVAKFAQAFETLLTAIAQRQAEVSEGDLSEE